MLTQIINGKILTPQGWLKDGSVIIRDGKIFTELRRGDTDRREFFDRIMEVVAMMGGEGSDAL